LSVLLGRRHATLLGSIKIQRSAVLTTHPVQQVSELSPRPRSLVQLSQVSGNGINLFSFLPPVNDRALTVRVLPPHALNTSIPVALRRVHQGPVTLRARPTRTRRRSARIHVAASGKHRAPTTRVRPSPSSCKKKFVIVRGQ